MKTIYETTTNFDSIDRYVFDKETEKNLKKLGITPSNVVIGQYHNEDLTVYLYAQANDKYFISTELRKLENDTIEDFLMNSDKITTLVIKIDAILK